MTVTFTWNGGSKFHLDVFFKEIRRRVSTFFYFSFAFSLLPILIAIYVVFWTRCFLVGVFVKVRWRKRNARVAAGMDTVWTCDIPGVNYSINTVLFLNGKPNVAEIKHRVDEQLRQKPALHKFRQHLVEMWGVCVWKDADNFNISNHLVIENDRPITSEFDLQEILADLSVRPFRKENPPWQIVILPFDQPYNATPDGQSQFCLLFRADHILADGLSLVHLLMNHVMDCTSTIPAPPPPPQSTRYLIYSLWRRLHAFYHTPDSLLEFFGRKERNALHGQPLTKDKIVRWSQPIPLATLKRIRYATQSTINDIYLSCLSGALRRHLLTASAHFPQPVTAIIPISLNQSPDDIACENNISFAHILLPVSVADCRSRLSSTSHIMSDCKKSPELLVNAWMCRRLVNCLPLALTRSVFRESPATIVSSTVPGPPATINLWGYNINSIKYFSPHRGHTGVTACFMSYAGQATLTVYADAALVDSHRDIERIVERFSHEVDQLAALLEKTEIVK